MKITTTLYIHEKTYGEGYDIYDIDLSDGNKILLDTIEVELEFNPPSAVEIRDIKVDHLKGQIEKEKADHAVTIDRLMGDIQKLMAIES